MAEHDKNLLILSFVQRYGIERPSYRPSRQYRGIVEGYDLNRPAGQRPSHKAMHNLVYIQTNIGPETAQQILDGEKVSSRKTIAVEKAMRTIAAMHLPGDLQAASHSTEELARVMRESYPEAYAEYEKWVQAPKAYMKATAPDIFSNSLIQMPTNEAGTNPIMNGDGMSSKDTDGVGKVVQRIHESYKRDTGKELAYKHDWALRDKVVPAEVMRLVKFMGNEGKGEYERKDFIPMEDARKPYGGTGYEHTSSRFFNAVEKAMQLKLVERQGEIVPLKKLDADGYRLDVQNQQKGYTYKLTDAGRKMFESMQKDAPSR